MAAEWTEGVCGDGAAILRDGVMIPIEDVVEALNKRERAIERIVRHWREFGGMMVFNNAVNRDDYGLDEIIEDAAKQIGA